MMLQATDTSARGFSRIVLKQLLSNIFLQNVLSIKVLYSASRQSPDQRCSVSLSSLLGVISTANALPKCYIEDLLVPRTEKLLLRYLPDLEAPRRVLEPRSYQ